jgi:hypothetical protein
MSDFADLYAELALPHVMGFHGQSVTYVGDAGALASVTAIVGPEAAECSRSPDDGRTRLRHRPIEVYTADVPSPRMGHTPSRSARRSGPSAPSTASRPARPT